MEDILKRASEIDEEGLEICDGFLESYKKYEEILKSFNSKEKKNYYSCELDKFNSDCLECINYLRECSLSSEISILYILRTGNLIHYGKYDEGEKIDKGVIAMIGEEDLRRLYELIQSEFSSVFWHGCKHTYGEGWSLNPTIGENIMIEINSDVYSDRSWFYEESHREQNSLSKK